MLRAALLLCLAALLLPFGSQATYRHPGEGRSDEGNGLADWIDTRPDADGVSLAGAQVTTAPTDHHVVTLAAEDLRRDLATVTGRQTGGDPIWAGTVGKNPAIDRLIAGGKLDAKPL